VTVYDLRERAVSDDWQVVSADPEALVDAPEPAPEDDEVHDGQIQDDEPAIDDDDGEEE